MCELVCEGDVFSAWPVPTTNHKKIGVLRAANKRNKKHTVISNKSKAGSLSVLSPATMDATDAAEALLVLDEELDADDAVMAMLFESSSDNEEESVPPHDPVPNKERDLLHCCK